MLRRMKVLLSVMGAALCLGLGAPVLATGDFEREPFIDREELLEELILRDRLFGPPFGNPFVLNRPFGNPFFLDPFIVNRPFVNRPFVDPFDFEEELFEFEDDD